MVDLQLPTEVTKATFDIVNKLISFNPTCGFGFVPQIIVIVAKPTNTVLDLYLPISGATVEGRALTFGFIEIPYTKKTTYADINGFTYGCMPIIPTYLPEFRVKQYNVDFGNGYSQFSNWIRPKSFGDIVLFKGNINVPCPVISPSIGVSGFNELTSTPKIFTQPLNIPFSGYGTIPMSGDFEIKINNISIKTGKVVDGKVDFTFDNDLSNLLTKLYVPPALPPTSAIIELIVIMGNCTFKKSLTVNIPKPPTLPCIGSFVPPDMSSLLSGITTIPSSLFVPIKLTGDKTSVPVDIFISGIRVMSQPTGFTGFDLIKAIKNYSSNFGSGVPNFSTYYTVTIKSLATDCKIPDLVIPIKPLAEITICTPPQIPNPITGKCETPSIPGCDKLITTVEEGYPSHPKEITDFLAPFYVYLRGVREVCKSDPTNPAFISKLPKGTPGIITLGNLSANFNVGESDEGLPLGDGIVDINLAKLINLPSLAGVTDGLPGEVTDGLPGEVTDGLPGEVTDGLPGERIGSYCTLTPYQAFGQTWYKVVHDSMGNLASGDTYAVAKHKAETNQHCFPKAAEPCIKINIYHIVRNRRNIIGFTTTALRNGMYAEGSSNWEYLGSPSDADYIKNTAIPQTMKFLGITRDRICP